MRFFTFSLFVIAVIFTLGCSAENPICTTNFCAIGEVFPRSELEDAQAFSEVDIDDSVIFATLIGGTTPVPVKTPHPNTVGIDMIVADVANKGEKYLGKTLAVTAQVDLDATAFTDNDSITLVTNNDNVVFYVNSRETPDRVAQYQKGQTYTFNIFIRAIDPPEEFFPEYAIWSNLPTKRVSTTMDALIQDITSGGRTFIDKIVSLRATVKFNAETFFDDDEDYETISLITNAENVSFFLTHELRHPSILAKYKEGVAYDFTFFIARITPSNDKYLVSAYVVLD